MVTTEETPQSNVSWESDSSSTGWECHLSWKSVHSFLSISEHLRNTQSNKPYTLTQTFVFTLILYYGLRLFLHCFLFPLVYPTFFLYFCTYFAGLETFMVAFVTVQKVIFSFVKSLGPSVHWHETTCQHWEDFTKFYVWGFSENLSIKLKFH